MALCNVKNWKEKMLVRAKCDYYCSNQCYELKWLKFVSICTCNMFVVFISAMIFYV